MRKLTQYGFWLGVLLACTPLFMYLYGGAKQFQLDREWQDARSEVPSQGAAPATMEDDGLARLNIPRLNVRAMIVGDVTNNALAEGPGHMPSTALPGEAGNCVIAAHRNVWGCWFADLDKLEPGDQIIVETLRQHYYYRVTGTDVVLPTNRSVLRAHGHKPEITLITCTLPVTHRLVVHGILDHTTAT